MRIPTILLNFLAVGSIGLISVGATAAAAFAAEMSGRVKLSGVPDERVTLRSSTAPITRIDLAPSAKQLAIAAANSKFPQSSGIGNAWH